MSNRKPIPKNIRQSVYEKCNGHCAYCGCEISFKGFNVDHVKCLRNHEWEDDSIDKIDNMLPSCRSCNQYKSTYELEVFREQLSKIPERIERDVSTYGIAKRFGMVVEQRKPIKFYFEKLAERKSSHETN